jgi:hypothetical protein
MTRLSPVLDADDLPPAELQAMRLDGELYALAGAWCPVDVLESAAVRASAVMAGRSPRLVAELRTAAWIWGVPGRLRRPLELCADLRARARLRPGADALIREVHLDEGDVVPLGGARVTSPLRTVLDLARSGRAEPVLLRRVIEVTGLGADEVEERLRTSRAPGVRRARMALISPRPEDGSSLQ